MRRLRSQSAMEYLMTYGWAILIIAVVLGALYSLGVFNAVNFAPKVGPGGCHVFRPNGPGTSWNVNLVGSCNNALPQYVAQFNGANSIVQLPSSAILRPSQFTVSVWIDPSTFIGTQGYTRIVVMYNDYPYALYFDNRNAGTGYVNVYINNALHGQVTITKGVWSNMVLTYNGAVVTVYTNGGSPSSQSYNSPLSYSGSDNLLIGYYSPSSFNGSIANVQIYNTSLTANQIAYLYNEGIGGVPISPQYLLGWWPLNGDTNDYSGNNNNGIPANIVFNGTWSGGYNAP